MRMRTRKAIGAAVMTAFVVFYALVAMALAQARPIQEAVPAIQVICYALLGIVWIFPLMPLIRWMQRPDL